MRVGSALIVSVLFLIPISASAAFETSLKYGAKGAAVVELQEFLIEKGFMTGTATGNFYSLTLKGVKSFQTANLLPSTGYFGPMSRAKANELIAADLSTSEEEVQEFGAVQPPLNTDTLDAISQKIAELNAKLAELNTKTEQNTAVQQQQQTTLQQNQTTLEQIQQNTAPAAEPTPEPTPEPPAKPQLIGQPTLTFSGSIIASLSFKADKEVICDRSSSGAPTAWGTDCTITVPNQSRAFYSGCNAPYEKGYYLFSAGKTYTCNLDLTERSATVTQVPFTFTVPN